MPKITFVNEHRVIEVESGRNVRDVARDANIAIDANRFHGVWSCGGHGMCSACVCWIDESTPGAGGPRSVLEKLRGLKGWRRLACRTRVTGDVKVFTMPAAGNRVGVARPIDASPSPVVDPNAPRKKPDAAATAEFIHGHPSMIGEGATVGDGAMNREGAMIAEAPSIAPPDTSPPAAPVVASAENAEPAKTDDSGSA